MRQWQRWLFAVLDNSYNFISVLLHNVQALSFLHTATAYITTKQCVDNVHEFRNAKRFRYGIVHTCPFCLLDLFSARICTNCDDWYMSSNMSFLLQGPDLPCARHAVHHRHLNVHQHNREIVRLRDGGLLPVFRFGQFSKCFTTVVGDLYSTANLLELIAKYALIDEVIFDNKNMILWGR